MMKEEILSVSNPHNYKGIPFCHGPLDMDLQIGPWSDVEMEGCIPSPRLPVLGAEWTQ